MLVFVLVVVAVVFFLSFLLFLLVPSDPLSARIFSHVLPNVNKVFMSMIYTVSTLSVRGGLGALSAVLPNVNQAFMSVLHTVSTLSLMSKPVITFVFKVLRNGLLRYTLYACPNLRLRSCSKGYGMDNSGAYFTHVQTCDCVRVPSAEATPC